MSDLEHPTDPSQTLPNEPLATRTRTASVTPWQSRLSDGCAGSCRSRSAESDPGKVSADQAKFARGSDEFPNVACEN